MTPAEISQSFVDAISARGLPLAVPLSVEGPDGPVDVLVTARSLHVGSDGGLYVHLTCLAGGRLIGPDNQPGKRRTAQRDPLVPMDNGDGVQLWIVPRPAELVLDPEGEVDVSFIHPVTGETVPARATADRLKIARAELALIVPRWL